MGIRVLRHRRINTLIDQGLLIVHGNVTIAEDVMLCVRGPEPVKPVVLCDRCLLRSGCVIYAGCHLSELVTIGHNSVLLANTEIGASTYLGGLVYCEEGVKIGKHCGIGAASYVTKGVVLEDYVFFGPCVSTANDKDIRYKRDGHGAYLQGPRFKKGCRIGAGAAILPGLTVGKNALVGAGSVVTKDVEDNVILFGTPARERGEVPQKDRL